jgi:hypothetical protein
MPNFGVEFYGHHAIVKMRVVIPAEHVSHLRKSFPNIDVYEARLTKTGKPLTAIEGCIPHNEYATFIGCVRNSIISRKINDLRNGYTHHSYPLSDDIFLSEIENVDVSAYDDDDELPF